MKPIVLQFLGAEDLPSEAIEWFSQGEVAHVDAVLQDGPQRNWLLGARHDAVGGAPPGVQIRTPGYKTVNRLVRATLNVGDAMADRFYQLIHAEIGKPYDSQGILGFVMGRDWRDPKAWFCSELQGAMLEACGYFPELATPSNKLTPAGLLLAVSATRAAIEIRNGW